MLNWFLKVLCPVLSLTGPVLHTIQTSLFKKIFSLVKWKPRLSKHFLKPPFNARYYFSSPTPSKTFFPLLLFPKHLASIFFHRHSFFWLHSISNGEKKQKKKNLIKPSYTIEATWKSLSGFHCMSWCTCDNVLLLVSGAFG